MKRLLLVLLAACKAKHAHREDAKVVAAARDAAVADAVAEAAWPELANLPTVEPVRVIALPAKLDVPRFTVGGPVVVKDVAVVSSSQFGFIAVDYARGQIAWTKPAGAHVAPPAVLDGSVVLIGECVNAPDVKDGETLLGCMRVVTPTGADQGYVAIHGKAKLVAPFAGAAGAQHVDAAEPEGERGPSVVWRRGDQAVMIDLMSGVATLAPATDPPVIVTYKDKTWRVRRTEDGVIAAEGTPPWQTRNHYSVLLGAVYLPQQPPMIRMANATRHAGRPEIMIFDIDATGSLNGQVGLYPAPGIGVISHDIDKVGDVAMAVRLDTSLERDYIAGYAANAGLMWTYPLPRIPRPDPIGVAVAPGAVVVFHDGDTFTVLPELSAPPTAVGAVKPPSENTTP